LIKSETSYEITERGLGALANKEKDLEAYLSKDISKEICAKYSLLGNVGLSALEFVIGLISGSVGLIADAVHTAVDIVASAITWMGIRINKEVHAGFLGGVILCGVGAFILFESITKITEGAEMSFQIVALVTIVLNIVVNGFFSHYKFLIGGRTRSVALITDAYHTKTDIWSSAAVFVGLLGATMGFFILDVITGAVVSVFIVFGGYELISESRKVIHGGDPRIEKFSRFLEQHRGFLLDMGTLASLWLLNLQEMTKEKHLNCLKRGLMGRRFPVGLEEKDYDSIYAKLENDGLVEFIEGKLKLTERGIEELKDLAIKRASPVREIIRRKFWFARRINYITEGL